MTVSFTDAPASSLTGAPVVSIDDLSVEFPVLSADSQSLRATLLHLISGRRLKPAVGMTVRAEALKRVSLEARQGDRIALIGRNGAGKSTLLKVLAGVYHPTGGRIAVNGRVSALLAGSMGLDADLSGWEAIDIGCLLFGMSAAEIRERRDEIAEFTELGGYLDMPVRTYSGGMRVRLAFAIATSISPDILLIDEVIGAGDAHFIHKARQRITSLVGGAKAVFIASHSSDILRAVCTRGVLMDGGEIVCAGEVDEVLAIYHRHIAERTRAPSPPAGAPEKPIGSAAAPGCGPDKAFDGDVKTHWLSAAVGAQVAVAAWLGVDYPEPREVSALTLRQWNGAVAGNTVADVIVQQSDDGFAADIRDVGKLPLSSGIERQSFDLPPAPAARGWRILAASGTAGGAWGVTELDFICGRKPLDAKADGRPISGPYYGQWDASHAFDGRSDTMWVARERAEEVKDRSWVGMDYGLADPHELRRVLIQQWNGGARPNVVSAVRVEASDDGFFKDVRAVADLTLAENAQPQLFALPPSAPARHWRIRATAATRGGYWGIMRLEFDTTPEPAVSTANENAIHDVTPLASGHYHAHAPKLAFDGRLDSAWISAQSGDGLGHTAFIGADLGPGRESEVREVVVQQAAIGTVPEFVGSAVVQASDDNFISDIRDIATLTLPRSILRHSFALPASRPARYWRLLAAEHLSHPDARWAVTGLEWLDAEGHLVAGAAASFGSS